MVDSARLLWSDLASTCPFIIILELHENGRGHEARMADGMIRSRILGDDCGRGPPFSWMRQDPCGLRMPQGVWNFLGCTLCAYDLVASVARYRNSLEDGIPLLLGNNSDKTKSHKTASDTENHDTSIPRNHYYLA